MPSASGRTLSLQSYGPSLVTSVLLGLLPPKEEGNPIINCSFFQKYPPPHKCISLESCLNPKVTQIIS